MQKQHESGRKYALARILHILLQEKDLKDKHILTSHEGQVKEDKNAH